MFYMKDDYLKSESNSTWNIILKRMGGWFYYPFQSIKMSLPMTMVRILFMGYTFSYPLSIKSSFPVDGSMTNP